MQTVDNLQQIKIERGPLEWTGLTRTGNDPCYIDSKTCMSLYPGKWSLTSYDPFEEGSVEHQQRLNTLMTFQKEYYPGPKFIDCDSKLIHPKLTNLRTLHPLPTRPYVGNYKGPGHGSLDPVVTEIESKLIQGDLDSVYHGKSSSADITEYAFNYLPPFGNPQRVEHVVQPSPLDGGWIRGGAPTRDLVKDIDYKRRILNEENSQMLRNRYTQSNISPYKGVQNYV